MYDDTQRYLNKAEPTGAVHYAEIIVKGRVRAKLYGKDGNELRNRARRYTNAMNWHAADVNMGQSS